MKGSAPRLGEIGLDNYPPYLMNRIMGRYNAAIRAEMAKLGLTTPKMRALAVLSVMVGENLWVLITTAAAGLLERLLGLLALGPGFDLLQVQLAALALVLIQNLLIVLCLHAVAYWIFPRLQSPISEPPPALRALVALDPL